MSQGYHDLPVTVPCGQCVGCRLEYSRQWAVRCHHEASLHANNTFTTLTYNKESLPDDGSLSLRHLQLFMKRLRKKFGPGIRFYACGEYGEKKRRPHYHICLFNFEPPDLRYFSTSNGNRLYSSECLDKVWGLGYTLSGAVTFQSAAYVARYILKKITGPMSDLYYETYDPETGEFHTLKKEFTTQSRNPGIAKHWLDTYHADVFNHDYVIMNGKKVRPPKYYDRQYEILDPEGFEKIRLARVRSAKKHSDNNTPARLRVRETVQNAKLKRLPRKIES